MIYFVMKTLSQNRKTDNKALRRN